MTSTSPRSGGLLAVIALVLALLGGHAWGQPGGTGPGGGAKPDHSAHDRTKLPKDQRAEAAVKHGEELRKRIDDFNVGTTPCPQTAKEWEEALDLLAEWKACLEVRDLIEKEFKGELDGKPLGQRYDQVFNDRKKATRAAEARLNNCNPPANLLGPNDVSIVQVAQRRVQRWIDIKKGLAGMIPLAVIDCPDCKRGQERVNSMGSDAARARR